MQLFLLYESAAGYALFEKEEFEEIGGLMETIQSSIGEMNRFSKLIKLKAFAPFQTSDKALHNINMIANSDLPEDLIQFLTLNLAKPKKKKKYQLGVIDPKLAQK